MHSFHRPMFSLATAAMSPNDPHSVSIRPSSSLPAQPWCASIESSVIFWSCFAPVSFAGSRLSIRSGSFWAITCSTVRSGSTPMRRPAIFTPRCSRAGPLLARREPAGDRLVADAPLELVDGVGPPLVVGGGERVDQQRLAEQARPPQAPRPRATPPARRAARVPARAREPAGRSSVLQPSPTPAPEGMRQKQHDEDREVRDDDARVPCRSAIRPRRPLASHLTIERARRSAERRRRGAAPPTARRRLSTQPASTRAAPVLGRWPQPHAGSRRARRRPIPPPPAPSPRTARRRAGSSLSASSV